MKIPYINLSLQWNKEKKKLLPLIEKVFQKGNYVGGEEIKKFEKNISNICHTKYAVALNSGTDALLLALHLAGVKRGDEVITPPNSFIASTSVIVHLGAKPIFVDVLPDQNINPDLIERAITKKTKAIMPVHLTGRVCEMNKIMNLSKKYNIPIIEDAAQSVGSKLNNKMSGSFGNLGCFSAHPLKNLNGCGDGGYLTTNNKNFYLKATQFRNHGLSNRNLVKKFGFLSRMDVLQSVILNYRIKNLKKTITTRRKNAKLYFENLNQKKIFFPKEKKEEFNTYHTFVIQVNNRDKLIRYLASKGIQTAIHYPIPLHLQPAAKYLNYKKGDFPVTEVQAKKILTLPIHQNLKEKEILYIIKNVNNFFK
ncbi:MAG: transcriptional regulator [Candidatus Pelagibacter sp. TMED64]|nr:transcriptional regulator [Candidatus Pelagibacter sp.]OUU66292.1 MAG: transcriptional regulator [Candidatus Pelagibacter sp. TMED64]|tara:strand:+ start:2030 stop:3127 length:1098 start_codon:yes stop_codon:yes gene_type:complete